MENIERIKPRDKKMLVRRRDFLYNRIGMSSKDLSYDKSEANALDRVIRLIECIESKPWLEKEIYGEED